MACLLDAVDKTCTDDGGVGGGMEELTAFLTLELPPGATDSDCDAAELRRRTLHLPTDATTAQCEAAELAVERLRRRALHLPAGATTAQCEAAERRARRH